MGTIERGDNLAGSRSEPPSAWCLQRHLRLFAIRRADIGLALWLLDARHARQLRVGSKILSVKPMPGGQLGLGGCAITVLRLSSGLPGHVILTASSSPGKELTLRVVTSADLAL